MTKLFKQLFTVIDSKEDAIQLREEFLYALEEAYTTYSTKPIRKYLHKDLHHHSFYVLEEMHSKDRYLSYMTKKLSSMMQNQKEYKFTMMEYMNGYPFLMVTNHRDNKGGYLGFFVKNNEWGKITEIGIMPASMMRNLQPKQKKNV